MTCHAESFCRFLSYTIYSKWRKPKEEEDLLATLKVSADFFPILHILFFYVLLWREHNTETDRELKVGVSEGSN